MRPLLIAAAAIFGLAAIGSKAAAAAQDSGDTSGPGTDPPSDLYGAVVIAMAEAIAQAEGFNSGPTALPARNHNPGDLKDTVTGEITLYPDDPTGWAALYNQVNLMLTGASHVYRLDMALSQVAVLWTGGDNPDGWARTVASSLGVTADTTLGDIAQGGAQ